MIIISTDYQMRDAREFPEAIIFSTGSGANYKPITVIPFPGQPFDPMKDGDRLVIDYQDAVVEVNWNPLIRSWQVACHPLDAKRIANDNYRPQIPERSSLDYYLMAFTLGAFLAGLTIGILIGFSI